MWTKFSGDCKKSYLRDVWPRSRCRYGSEGRETDQLRVWLTLLGKLQAILSIFSKKNSLEFDDAKAFFPNRIIDCAEK